MSHTYALVIKSLTREMLDKEKKFHLGDRIAAFIWVWHKERVCGCEDIWRRYCRQKLWCCVWSMALINMIWTKKAYLLAYIFSEYNVLLLFLVDSTILQLRVKMFIHAFRYIFYGCNRTNLPFMLSTNFKVFFLFSSITITTKSQNIL